ncbi:MAG: hypothetical protein QM675_08265 [Protaetiibacter sp.]
MSTRAPEADDEEDDALHWAGDEARGQAAPRLRDDGLGADAPAEPVEEKPDAPRTPRDTAFLVGTGAFALGYLALTIGWIFSVQLLVNPGVELLGEIMWQFGEFLAMVAPALWFAATVTLTPEGTRRRGVARMVALLVGAALLVPWPGLLYWIGSTQ